MVHFPTSTGTPHPHDVDSGDLFLGHTTWKHCKLAVTATEIVFSVLLNAYFQSCG